MSNSGKRECVQMEKSVSDASFYYSVNMLRALLKMGLITKEEYKKIIALNAEYYGVETLEK